MIPEVKIPVRTTPGDARNCWWPSGTAACRPPPSRDGIGSITALCARGVDAEAEVGLLLEELWTWTYRVASASTRSRLGRGKAGQMKLRGAGDFGLSPPLRALRCDCDRTRAKIPFGFISHGLCWPGALPSRRTSKPR